MTTHQQDRDDRLPPEVAERLRAAARRRTEGIAPFPGVALAVRRDRRRRAGAVAVAAAACVFAATVATGAVRADRAAPPPAIRPTPTVATPTTSPTPERGDDPFSRTGPAAGSLADDTEFLAGMRQRVAGAGGGDVDLDRVRVLWATDDGVVRYALTVVRQQATDVISKKTDTWWWFQGYRGVSGAAPADMAEHSEPMDGSPDTGDAGAQYMVFMPLGDGAGKGIVAAFGRDLADVEVASGLDWSAAGERTASWQRLRREGAVWWAEVDEEQRKAVTLRARFPDGTRGKIWGNGTFAAPLPLERARDVAPAGADAGTLGCAAGAFDRNRGGFPASATPVLAATAKRGEEWLGFAATRATGGGYLIGTCRTRHPEWPTDGADTADGFVVPAPDGGADRLFAVLPVQAGQPAADEAAETATKLLAIAPVGATEVTFGDVTAPVTDRMAIIDFPDRTPIRGVTATARDAAGKALATTEVARLAYDLELEAFYGTRSPEVPRYVTPTS